MNVFLYDDYKKLLRAKIQSLAKKGRGEIERIAKALNVHQSFVSQVLNTERNFSEEQAYTVCKHLSFTDLHTEYFIALVQLARTTNQGLKIILKRNILRIKNQTEAPQDLDRNITSLAEEDKNVFYSNWSYMAVWLLTSISGFDNVENISKQLHLPLQRVVDIAAFLIQVGLCTEAKGKLSINIKKTLVTKGSPSLSRHHLNWRLRGMDLVQTDPPHSLFYTCPMAISERDGKLIKEILIRTIANIEPLIEPSPAEKTFCLNIDWFEF